MGPAPKLRGETSTRPSMIAAITLIDAAGRSRLTRSSSPPQAGTPSSPARASAQPVARRMSTANPTPAPAPRAAVSPDPVQRVVRAVRPWAYDPTPGVAALGSPGPLVPAARDGRVPRGRHGDQRPSARALRADRGGRRARRRWRAARPLVGARRRVGAALARDPAVHGHLAGDGRPCAAAGGGAAGARADAARPRARRALGAVRS